MTPTLPPVPAPRLRSVAIDVLRGLAITLVALGHTSQGVNHRGWWNGSSLGYQLEGIIYSFHMPAFFFVSGIFLRSSVAKRGPTRFVSEKFRSMIWPYLVFSLIGFLAVLAFNRFMVQSRLTFREFCWGVVTGQVSWFLPTIFFAVIVGMLVRKLPPWLFFLVACALSTWYPHVTLNYVTRGIKFLPFLALGMWVGRSYERVETIPPGIAALGTGISLALLIAINLSGPPDTSLLFIPLGILGTFMLLLFARLLGRSPLAHFFAWVGEASLGIFLLAPYPQGFGRELLLHLHHTTNPWLQTLFPTLLAVTLPALLYQYRHRLHIGWTFLLPAKAAPASTVGRCDLKP